MLKFCLFFLGGPLLLSTLGGGIGIVESFSTSFATHAVLMNHMEPSIVTSSNFAGSFFPQVLYEGPNRVNRAHWTKPGE